MSALMLPASVLKEVLLYCVIEDAPAFARRRGYRCRVTYLGWLAFGQVCRSWRMLSLDCDSAWAMGYTQFPYGLCPGGLSLLSERARDRPRLIRFYAKVWPDFKRFKEDPDDSSKVVAYPDPWLLEAVIAEGELHLAEEIYCTWHNVCQLARGLLEQPQSDATFAVLRKLCLEGEENVDRESLDTLA